MPILDDDEFPRTLIRTRPTPESGQLIDATGHYLVAIEGSEVGKRVEISASPVMIGRNERQTLVFANDTEVSRIHARVSLVDGSVVAEDLGSTNGTFIDSERITTPVMLREGSVIQVGQQMLKYERRSQRDVARLQALDRDLHKASNYLFSMLPAPVETGPVLAEWNLVPSTQLGGDALGYYWVDPDTFAFYLMDVSGHGVGAAMHSVAVINMLRQRALANVDFGDPAEVLANLNTRFQMQSHGDMYFTMWYGVYRPSDRTLRYASAGHHPAYLVPSDRGSAHPLGITPALMIGALPDVTYRVHQATVPPGAAVYLFSDGVFEIVATDGRLWTLSDLVPHLIEPRRPGVSEPERLYQLVRQTAYLHSLEDDFSLLTVTFQ
jgi:serine phosphatase RsbU (regulator of sigma subunit)